MKVLIVGGGGREHALAWKAAQSHDVEQVYVAPGNAGTAGEHKVQNIPLTPDDVAGLIHFARENAISLTIIGPEAPLVAGIVDRFAGAGLRCFGPSKNAARLEGSKSYSKAFLKRHNIPAAEYDTFTDIDAAMRYVGLNGAPIVIKADGLAGGKGVVIAKTEGQAIAALTAMLSDNTFGKAGDRVVIEEYLQGEEASFMVICDGKNVIPFASSQDHKARDAGDTGPNTGGMGAYSPAAVITPALSQQIRQNIIEPAIEGMASEGNAYTGFLYAGLMISDSGIARVLEFNCRLGDPETQPMMMRLQSDLPRLCDAALDKKLDEIQLAWDERAALGVVLAAKGYPLSARTGDPIHGLDGEYGEDVKVFHAGTSFSGDQIITAGGRVVCVTALAEKVSSAQRRVYKAIEGITWDGMFYRADIGHRAVARE